MENKKIVSILLVAFMVVNIAIYSLYKPSAKAETIVKQWTFSDNSVNLSYDVTEYQDDKFVIEEYYYHSLSRTIVGHAYFDSNTGYARAVVDDNTQSYWNAVMSDYERKDNIQHWASLVEFMTIYLTPNTFLEYIAYRSSTAIDVAYSYISEHSRLATDTDKTMYEMSCADECAWDLVNNPNVIIPSNAKPRK